MTIRDLHEARTVLALRRVIDAAGMDKRVLAVRIRRHNDNDEAATTITTAPKDTPCE